MTAQRVPSATAKTAENAYGFDLNCRTEEHKGEYDSEEGYTPRKRPTSDG